MPREHRPPPNESSKNRNEAPTASIAGPYGPRNTLSSSQTPSFLPIDDHEDGVAVVDLSSTPPNKYSAQSVIELNTPKFGESSPLRSKVSGVGGAGGLGACSINIVHT